MELSWKIQNYLCYGTWHGTWKQTCDNKGKLSHKSGTTRLHFLWVAWMPLRKRSVPYFASVRRTTSVQVHTSYFITSLLKLARIKPCIFVPHVICHFDVKALCCMSIATSHAVLIFWFIFLNLLCKSSLSWGFVSYVRNMDFWNINPIKSH